MKIAIPVSVLSVVFALGCSDEPTNRATVEPARVAKREYISNGVRIRILKSMPIENLDPNDPESVLKFGRLVNNYDLLIDYPSTHSELQSVSKTVNGQTAERSNLEIKEINAATERTKVTAIANLNSPQYGIMPMTLTIVAKFKDGEEMRVDFEGLKKDLYIGSSETSTPKDRDFFLSSYVSSQATMAEIDNLVFQRGATLVTEESSIQLEVNHLIGAEQAALQTFTDAQLTKPEIGRGRSGGKVRVKAQSATGTLRVLMKGEIGLRGKDGADGRKGDDGANGFSGDRNAGCIEKHRQPKDGQPGGNGVAGGNGGNGGNSGSIEIRILKNLAFNLEVQSQGGAPGMPGLGGKLGLGGKPGGPGRGEFCRWVGNIFHSGGGYNECDERVCNVIYEGDKVRSAVKGADGLPGPAGELGQAGLAEEFCVQLTADEPLRCRK